MSWQRTVETIIFWKNIRQCSHVPIFLKPDEVALSISINLKITWMVFECFPSCKWTDSVVRNLRFARDCPLVSAKKHGKSHENHRIMWILNGKS